jgi:phosphohistidine phosphatase SixA
MARMSVSRVYLVRHAKAEKEHPRGDAARGLTVDGRESFELLARDIGRGLAITRILSSPFERALETARVLADLSGAAVEEDEALTSGRSGGEELLEVARGGGGGVALVGHNPEIQEAISRASGRDEVVRPGTIAAVELNSRGSARLIWIAAPGRPG